MAPGKLAEPVMGPDVDAMLSTIGETAPPWLAAALGELKAATWQPMNSYVHGGIRAVVQTLAGSTPYQLVRVLGNGNGLALITGNLLVLANNDPTVVGSHRAHPGRPSRVPADRPRRDALMRAGSLRS